MSTRSSIAMKTNGKYMGVYCHWDGYPEHNGKILSENYNTEEKVKELISHGDISSLNEKCDKPEGHSYDSPAEGRTVYYGRDRGEEDVDTSIADDYDDLLEKIGQEYDYLFEDGKWTVSGHNIDIGTPLEDVLEKV